MTDPSAGLQLPSAVTETPRRFSIPLVWIIPLVAALIGAFLAVRAYTQQGPTIRIAFESGQGLEPGKTRIKYKDVDVGQITGLVLARDGSGVIATAQMAREATHLLVEDTRFWVVRAQVSGRNVTGLDTLLSGAHVGMDAGKSDAARREFAALAEAPAVTFDVPGTAYVLHADTLGSLGVGAPIFFRRIEAGQITGFRLDEAGTGLDLQVFIKAPYDRFVTEDTRFWHASGVDVKFSAEGLQLRTESLASVLGGGLAFQSREEGAERAPKGREFHLFRSREEAMKQAHHGVETYVLRFEESVRGLSVGAPVDFRGVALGEVTAIDVDFDDSAAELGMRVTVELYPERLRSRRAVPGLGAGKTSRQVIDRMVARGLRAQLRSGNLVSGQLYVALDFFPSAKPVKVEWGQTPVGLPTTKASLEELQATLTRILAKLDKLPLEEIGQDTRQAMASLTRAVAQAETLIRRMDGLVDGELRTTLEEARGALSEGRKLMAADAPLQQDARATLQELTRAAAALRQLADTLERHPEALLRGKPEEKP
ncbi:MAG: MlaD family protein [Rhodocyclaceae bacterium]|jgi:paraquat-inducible protein B|nr:MlaD family protein [Rhodocyclaceae bacterium]